MANRYNTIVRNVVHRIAVNIENYLDKVPDASWSCKDGKLIAHIKGEEYEMTFEDGDPLTEALKMFLNNKALVLSRLKDPAQ